MNAASLKEAATSKLGPVPVWAIGGGIGLAAVLIMRRRKAAQGAGDTAAATDTSATAPDGSTDPLASRPLFRTGGAGGGTIGSTNLPEPATETLDTNDNWRRKAADRLIAQGYDALLVTAALSKFLNGEDLTQQEWAVANNAIALVGSPPSGVPTPRLIAGATTTTPPSTSTSTAGSSSAPADTGRPIGRLAQGFYKTPAGHYFAVYPNGYPDSGSTAPVAINENATEVAAHGGVGAYKLVTDADTVADLHRFIGNR